MLLCGRKFIDEGHSSSDEIKARCDQLQENWDELKNLAEQRCVWALLLVQLLDTLKIYSVFRRAKSSLSNPFANCWFLFCRQHKLDESLAYQQFSANVGEEESWINEKNTLVGSDDYGDTLAAVQVRQLTHTICGVPYNFQLLFVLQSRMNRTLGLLQNKSGLLAKSKFLFY